MEQVDHRQQCRSCCLFLTHTHQLKVCLETRRAKTRQEDRPSKPVSQPAAAGSHRNGWMNIFLSFLACVRFWGQFSCTPHRVMSSPQRRAGPWLIYPRSSPSPVSLLMQTIQCQEPRWYIGPNHDGRPCVWALDTDQLQPPTSHPPPQLPRLALGRKGTVPLRYDA
jgi:hypothetical protein